MKTKVFNSGGICMKGFLFVCAVVFAVGHAFCSSQQDGSGTDKLRVLFWNIQNGMWTGQDDNYDSFVKWVARQQPDICIWCEAQSIYLSGTDTVIPRDEGYLVDGWGELAARYGHSYVYVGGHRDYYPQVITSRYPIENVARITGAEPDSVVTHGAGWARVKVNGENVNLVALHLWPQSFAYGVPAAEREASSAANGGDNYRRMEMEYICRHTLETVPDAEGQMWIMAGDFNSRSRFDNRFYKYPEQDTRFLVMDYINDRTPFRDIIAGKYPGEFKATTGKGARIDYVFCTDVLYQRILRAEVISDEYTTPVRDPEGLSNFWYPSDHLPIIVDFDMQKEWSL